MKRPKHDRRPRPMPLTGDQLMEVIGGNRGDDDSPDDIIYDPDGDLPPPTRPI